MKIVRFSGLIVLLFCLILSCKKKKEVTTIADPIVSTASVADITNATAKCGGNVTDASNGNVSVRGVCWGVNQFPTVEKNSKTTDGAGLGAFTSLMTGLLPNKTYYVRAYATNEEGTGYGDDIIFTTSQFASFIFNTSRISVFPTDTLLLWGPAGIATAATSTINGMANTDSISARPGNYAAKFCAALVYNGFSDWYLPSSGELNAIAQNKTALGGFNDVEYWSSTETTLNTAVSVNFQTGAQNSSAGKSQPKRCRCVRQDSIAQ